MIFEANEGKSAFMRQSPKQHNLYYQTQRLYHRLTLIAGAIRLSANGS